MATWPEPPLSLLGPEDEPPRPPTPPAEGARFVVFGEQFPEAPPRAPAPQLYDDAADPLDELLRLNDLYAQNYLDLLGDTASAPAATYGLQLKVQELDQVVCNMLHLLATRGHALQALRDVVDAVEAQARRKEAAAEALDAAAAAAKANLAVLLRGGDAPMADAVGGAEAPAPEETDAEARERLTDAEAASLRAALGGLARQMEAVSASSLQVSDSRGLS